MKRCRCTVANGADRWGINGTAVSPLFRRSEEKAALKAAAKVEIERLRSVGVDDLAVDLFPGLGPDGPTHGTSVRVQQLCGYLLRDYPGAGQMDTLDLLAPVNRALDRLQDAGLVSPISVQRTPVWRITPLGESTLAEGNVRERLRGG
jgi:hypothetical protein